MLSCMRETRRMKKEMMRLMCGPKVAVGQREGRRVPTHGPQLDGCWARLADPAWSSPKHFSGIVDLRWSCSTVDLVLQI